MPIPLSDLKTNYLLLPPGATVADVRVCIAGQPAFTYLIAALPDGRMAVFFLADLIESLQAWRGPALTEATLATPLPAIPDFLEKRTHEPFDGQTLTPHQARQTLNAMPPTARGRFAVVQTGGTISGILADPFRYAARTDLRWLDQTPAPTPGTLSGSPTSTPSTPGKRYINVELLDSTEAPHNPKTTPLEVASIYTLSFDLDTILRTTAIAQKGTEFKYQFQEGETLAKITVRLESEDFTFYDGNEKLLLVPHEGKSKNKVKFLMEPKQTGEALLTALFLKEGNLIQVMTLQFYVGELFQTHTLGREVNAAFALRPRDLNLTILQVADGYQLVLTGPVAATCKLTLTPAQLQTYIEQARQTLLEIVYTKHGSPASHPFQAAIDIPPEVAAPALQKLALAGYELFRNLFYKNADAQTKNLADKLRQMAQDQPLKLQIFSQHFTLPWGILYLADRYLPGQPVNPDHFLGFKHILEHIPLQPDMRVTGWDLNGNDLTISLNLNRDIDTQMNYPLVAPQLAYWNAIRTRAGITLTERNTSPDLLTALADPALPDQLLYFYCHAESNTLAEDGGPEASRLSLTGGHVTLRDLHLYAPTDDPLPGNPLIFLNACESAELTPLFYDGFVQYFMAKGARGVIGTECETPALFGVKFAERFFDEFLTGKPLGEVMLALRKEFLTQHNNPLGLLYALYVDSDTTIQPGLNITAAN